MIGRRAAGRGCGRLLGESRHRKRETGESEEDGLLHHTSPLWIADDAVIGLDWGPAMTGTFPRMTADPMCVTTHNHVSVFVTPGYDPSAKLPRGDMIGAS